MDETTSRPIELHALRVAIIHHWLVTQRGGEHVLAALCEIFPNADIFTHVYDPASISPAIRQRRVNTSFIQKLPFSRRFYQRYLPLMPLAIEQADLRGYDLVISNESGPVKGVITPPETLHVCYCLTPMRYLWGMQSEYTAKSSRLVRGIFSLIAHYVRLWDYAAAARVDEFVGISRTVSRRIWKCYRRAAPVIWPPVDCDAFPVTERQSDYYLVAGQLVAYKRAQLAVQACNQLQRKLVVIGAGEELKHLRKLAGPTVSVLGSQTSDVLRSHFAGCRALIFPGEEDFGIVPVEAMASGAPVIALRKGGALDTVKENETGVFFDEPVVDDLVDAIRRFEAMEGSFDARRISAHARKFDKSEFKRRFGSFVLGALQAHRQAAPAIYD